MQRRCQTGGRPKAAEAAAAPQSVLSHAPRKRLRVEPLRAAQVAVSASSALKPVKEIM